MLSGVSQSIWAWGSMKSRAIGDFLMFFVQVICTHCIDTRSTKLSCLCWRMGTLARSQVTLSVSCTFYTTHIAYS